MNTHCAFLCKICNDRIVVLNNGIGMNFVLFAGTVGVSAGWEHEAAAVHWPGANSHHGELRWLARGQNSQLATSQKCLQTHFTMTLWIKIFVSKYPYAFIWISLDNFMIDIL